MSTRNTKLSLKGVIPPMVTLFDEQGKIDEESNSYLIDFLIKKGVNGIFILGTAGEFTHINLKEKKEFIEFAVKKVEKRVPVLVGVGSTSTDEVLDLATYAQDKKANAVVVINPYYEILEKRELYEHFKMVAEEISLPILLYNLPSLTGQNLDVFLIRKLTVEYENIVGIKHSVSAIDEIRDTITQVKKVRRDFSVFTGIPSFFLNTLVLGGDGVVPGEANFVPEIYVAMWEAYNRKDWEKVLQNFRAVLEISAICGLSSSLPGLLKEAIKMRGLPVNPRVRKPSLSPPEETKAELKALLETVGITKIWNKPSEH